MTVSVVPGYKGFVYQDTPATDALTLEIGLPRDPIGAVLPEFAAIDFTTVTTVTASVQLPNARTLVTWTFTVVGASTTTTLLVITRAWAPGDTSAVGKISLRRLTPYVSSTPLPDVELITIPVIARP